MNRKLLFLSLVLGSAAFSVGQPDLIKRGGAITVKVPSYGVAQSTLFDLVRKHNGTAADRNSAASEKGKTSGWSRVRVPKAELDAFLEEVRSLGKVYGESLSLVDGSEEYISLGKRAERLKQHEQRLSGILQSAKRLRGSDILYVQERLFRASVDEDMLAQQRESLAEGAGTSSVVVTFFEPTAVKEQPRGVLGHLKAAFTDALRTMAFNLLGSLTTILYWLIYLFIGWVLWRIFRRPLREGFQRLRASLEPSPAKVQAPPKIEEAQP